DRDARTWIRGRRGSCAPRREAHPTAGVRAPPRPRRADPHAAAGPAGGLFSGLSLQVRERPAAGEAAGALVLLHGRGADENELFPLLDELDPERRLHGYTPRGPLSLPPGGAQWYVLGGLGTPERETFAASYAALTAFLDGLPYERIVLGGFSQGCAMAYALALSGGQPRPDACRERSAFTPRGDAYDPDLEPPFP